jgi:hypothetical protein
MSNLILEPLLDDIFSKIKFLIDIRYSINVLLRAKKVRHHTSVSFEKFDVVKALLSFCL